MNTKPWNLLTQPARALATDIRRRFTRAVGKNYIEKYAYVWRLGDGKEQDSKFTVVHGCFTEGGDSIVGTFFCQPFRTKLQDVQRVSWLAD